MKSLEKWQLISFLSRGLAMGLGLIQSFVILRILSVSEWGITQLAVSIGASLGIYQHLGLASASNSEIAAAKKESAIFKIFITTTSIRYLVTIPLSAGLYFLAPQIARSYEFSEIVIPLRLYSVALLFQGVQAMLNAVISGTKRFKELFVLQAVIALASVVIYIPLVYMYKINGFFMALVLHELFRSTILGIVALKPYLTNLQLPTRAEFTAIFKELFSLGLTIYLVKILVINWEKAGTNLLGFMKNAQLLGIYAFSLLFAKKLVNISDAVTDVNLPVFSEKYAHNPSEFKELFVNNFNKIFAVILFFAFTAVFWAADLVALLIGNSKYDASLPLILPMVFAFVFYSLLDIVKSSVSIPAKHKTEMVLSFGILLISTIIFYVTTRAFFAPLFSMAYAMVFGSAASFFYLVQVSHKRLGFNFLNHSHVLILLQVLVICLSSNIVNLVIKVCVYLFFTAFYLWGLHVAEFITKKQLTALASKVAFFIRK